MANYNKSAILLKEGGHLKKKKRILIVRPAKLHCGESSTNKHHRKAKANGGGTLKGNISTVNCARHMAWHYFFNDRNGNPMNPEQIAARFQVLYPMIKTFFVGDDGNFKSMESVLAEINLVWLDPEYEIAINTEQEKSF